MTPGNVASQLKYQAGFSVHPVHESTEGNGEAVGDVGTAMGTAAPKAPLDIFADRVGLEFNPHTFLTC